MQAILRNDYSSASDVWSLGIVLYEIWSLGHEPYENLSIEEVISYINIVSVFIYKKKWLLLQVVAYELKTLYSRMAIFIYDFIKMFWRFVF